MVKLVARALPLLLVALAVIVAVAAPPASALTRTVTTEAQLRTAVALLSANPNGPHVIQLNDDVRLTQGELVYSGAAALTIRPAGAGDRILSGGGRSRILRVTGGAAVTFDRMELIQGYVNDTSPGSSDGGAVFSNGSVTLRSSRVADNVATNVAAVKATGDVMVVGTTVEHNEATRVVESSPGDNWTYVIMGNAVTLKTSEVVENNLGGGEPGLSYAVVASSVVAHGSTIADNGVGGAEAASGPLSLWGSTVSDNAGPGLRAWAGLTSEASTISGNEHWGVFAYGSGSVHNSTIHANDGAGLDLREGEWDVRFTTLTDNTLWNLTGGSGATVVVKGIAIGGGGLTCGSFSNAVLDDRGHNVYVGTCPLLDDPTTWRSLHLLLGPLANNGGPTPTRLFERRSPLHRVVPPARCPAVDQRGESRPQGGTRCDAGAVETVP